MCATVELGRCPFEDECVERHPEDDQYREGCSSDNCENCGRYWAFLDEKHVFDEIE